MGRPPAYIFVVRHGNRLDAADKKWHLSSPTPYDPPLTYSGWQQSKALGARIGDIIRTRIAQDEATRKSQVKTGTKPKRKHYRVVIHSSPFLRCVQTSTAISAGICASPSTSTYNSPALTSKPAVQDASIQKPVLRLDAFLGEWLNPDYYELITPPPGSVMMVASAKAELLRRENYGASPHFQHHVHSHSSPSNHLWGSPSPHHSPMTTSASTSSGLNNMVYMASTLPVPERTPRGGYVSPTPAFALSNNAPIPAGFVAHARDACLDVDYQWDSMRKPYGWGDGGEYGEEWSAMHRRFRNGVQKMMDWYAGAENPAEMVANGSKSRAGSFASGREAAAAHLQVEDDAEEVEEECVVVLVSHGAGCNALIGAITNQPVLADVAMSSLTNLERKSDSAISAGTPFPPPTPQATPTDTTPSLPLHRHYSLALFANTDHLRSSPSTPNSIRSPAMASALSGALSSSGFRTRYSNSFSSGLGITNGKGNNHTAFAHAEIATPTPSGNNSPRTSAIKAFRSGVNTPRLTRASSVVSTTSLGLWSPVVRDEEVMEDEECFDMLLDFPESTPSLPNGHGSTNGHSNGNGVNMDEKATTPREERTMPTPPPMRADTEERDGMASLGPGTGGLWGQPRLSPEIERIKALVSPKRRWTVNERA